MMGSYPSISPTETLSQEDQKEIQEGQKLYQQFQSKQVTCSNLKDEDFEKIGEFVMQQQIGNPQRHAQVNQIMQTMMGEQGETAMHTVLGRRATNCVANTFGGGGTTMMGNLGTPMMGWTGFGVMNVFFIPFWILSFVVLILLSIFLWKQIVKK